MTTRHNLLELPVMDVCLIVPGPLATKSGGHTYDRRMAECLRALGPRCARYRAGRTTSRTPTRLRSMPLVPPGPRSPPTAVRLIDGLALPAFAGLPLHRVIALIHHPASLETGVPDDIARRLRDDRGRNVPRSAAALS